MGLYAAPKVTPKFRLVFTVLTPFTTPKISESNPLLERFPSKIMNRQ